MFSCHRHRPEHSASPTIPVSAPPPASHTDSRVEQQSRERFVTTNEGTVTGVVRRDETPTITCPHSYSVHPALLTPTTTFLSFTWTYRASAASRTARMSSISGSGKGLLSSPPCASSPLSSPSLPIHSAPCYVRHPHSTGIQGVLTASAALTLSSEGGGGQRVRLAEQPAHVLGQPVDRQGEKGC